MPLTPFQEKLCVQSPGGYSTLRALLVNATLKKQVASSHTQLLLNVVGEIMATTPHP